jgi:hypothetical protein
MWLRLHADRMLACAVVTLPLLLPPLQLLVLLQLFVLLASRVRGTTKAGKRDTGLDAVSVWVAHFERSTNASQAQTGFSA